jgi:hypothetical protein
MNKQDFLDKLKRAVFMEEEMAGQLIDLCQPESLPEDLSEKDRRRVKAILLKIKEDTLRHKMIVTQTIEKEA